MKPRDSILEQTLAEAVRDVQTVGADGRLLRRLTEGVVIRDIPTHTDERGSVFEVFDERWDAYPDPLTFSYCFTIRPGIVKGWNLHKEHEDRYCLLQGELELVLFDPRPESSTCGEVCRIVLSELQRRVVNIPKLVWHADYNIGARDALVVNFPTKPYDHASPDKHRLPIDTPLIPYSFPRARGGW